MTNTLFTDAKQGAHSVEQTATDTEPVDTAHSVKCDELPATSSGGTENHLQTPDTKDLVTAIENAVSLFGKSDTVAALHSLTRKINAVKTTNQLNSLLYSVGSCVARKGAGRGKIPCQPTSIARRGPGRPRGAAALGKGRRPATLPQPKAKRPRNLAKNIKDNVANAKSHGSGH